MAQTYQFVVGPDEARLRLDRYLLGHLPGGFSRTLIQRAIREGAITIAGHALKAYRRLRAGETVVAHVAGPNTDPDPQTVVPEPMALAVVYEDAHVLVVNKPPHLVTHPAPGHPSGTLVNAIAWHLGHRPKTRDSRLASGVLSPESLLPRAGIVHRLDKDTSGLLVVAKTALALRELAKQLKARTMSRRYLALVEGHVPVDEGTINVGVGRHLTHRKEMAIRYLGGREAVTHYRVLKRFGTQDPRPKTHDARRTTQDASLESWVLSPSFVYTLLELRLETGRTHQIRVHLAHLGYPVLGDALYSRAPASASKGYGVARQLLHAYAVRFVHPATRQPLELSVGLPVDMQHWLDGFDVQAALAMQRR